MSTTPSIRTEPAQSDADRTAAVRHGRTVVDGHEIFYREAGAADAPVLLLPHGYPCSSYEFRNFMPALADRWRLIAPDFPGFGYSGTPEGFDYSFNGYARFLAAFADRLGLQRYVLYLHDYGSQIGLRLAIQAPEKIAGLIVQNGDIYADTLGPQYEGLLRHFEHPSDETRQKLVDAVSEDGYRDEFLNGIGPGLAPLVSPDLWNLHWALTTPRRAEIALALMEGLKENLDWFPKYQAYLREHAPPTLILWGPRDGYMPEASARAYLRDLPDAELHLFDDGGHWLLETHLDRVVALTRGFLERLPHCQR
ncbi:alpha/beta fold hydrolase [Lysobacter sp. 1R34A]|uniref:alpha/beta fold hydrolase n=1 Tax=Lysobacter sp. 1R34A TaxID=3445786 RepID=UPI003EF08751